MSTRYRVVVLGFGAFERQSLDSYFRLTHGTIPSFESARSIGESDFCVVDADQPIAVQAVMDAQRLETSVFVGASAPEGAPMHLHRPIDAMQVARALEALLHGTQPQTTAAPKPRTPVAAAARPAMAARISALPRGSAIGTPPATHFDIDVLVVDDSDIARRFLKVQLERYGCRVSVASSGEEAVSVLERTAPRIVFCDMVMPGLDGLALCQQVKERGFVTPAVALISARPTQADRVRARLAGCDAFLAKPLSAVALLEVLRDHGTDVSDD
jgi:hypothetical protein